MNISISCDFDGTITRADTVDAILEQFALPEWTEIEAEWAAGRIGSRECLAQQSGFLRATPVELDAFIDGIEVDEDVAPFFADCLRLGVPVSVVSDGFDWVVRRVLARMGLRGVPVIANRLVHVGDDRWTVRFPHSTPNCGSGVCKCSVVNSPARRVHIGDGRSDACVSDVCDVVFAKGWLLESRNRRNMPSIPFETFATVRAMLPELDVMAPAAAQRIA
jgi:2-hydroxy-3-keto-5-methylthiopentenyl-1-phosphate phosphatase